MRTIDVDPTVIDIPSYGSATEAIQAERSALQAKQAAMDSSRLREQLIKDFTISDQAICLCLVNGVYLEVAVVGKQVRWRVLESYSIVGDTSQRRGAPARLIWPGGSETIWDPGGLLESRRKFFIQRIFAGQVFLNICFKGGGILQFLPVWNRTDNLPLLYLSELERPLQTRPVQ